MHASVVSGTPSADHPVPLVAAAVTRHPADPDPHVGADESPDPHPHPHPDSDPRSEPRLDPVAIADAEADRLADLLHDGPVQALVVAHLAAESAARGGDPTTTRDAVQTALVELRRTLWHLRSRGRENTGLAGALALLSARLAEAGRPRLVVNLDEEQAALLDPSSASTAYRVVQAVALADAGGGSSGAPVRILVHGDGSRVVIDIDGFALPDADRWAARAQLQSGSLTTDAARTRLVLPTPLAESKVIP